MVGRTDSRLVFLARKGLLVCGNRVENWPPACTLAPPFCPAKSCFLRQWRHGGCWAPDEFGGIGMGRNEVNERKRQTGLQVCSTRLKTTRAGASFLSSDRLGLSLSNAHAALGLMS